MTLFEYVTVAISIVLPFGLILFRPGTFAAA